MPRDREQGDERGRLVHLPQARHGPRALRRPKRHCEAQADGDRYENQRDHPQGATAEPEDVLTGIRLGVHAAAAVSAGVPWARAPTSSTVPLSRTISPPWAARTSRAPFAPDRNAILERVSASSAVAPSEVAWITPVQAGSPVEGSRRW